MCAVQQREGVRKYDFLHTQYVDGPKTYEMVVSRGGKRRSSISMLLHYLKPNEWNQFGFLELTPI